MTTHEQQTADELHKKNIEELKKLEDMLDAFTKQLQEFEQELQERRSKK